MDDLFNVLLFGVGYLCVHRGTIYACVCDDCWHLWDGGFCQGLGHVVWLTGINLGRPKIPLQILHRPGERVQGSWSKIEDVVI